MADTPKATKCKKKSILFLLPIGLCCIVAGVLLLFLGQGFSSSGTLRKRQLVGGENPLDPPQFELLTVAKTRKSHIRGQLPENLENHARLLEGDFTWPPTPGPYPEHPNPTPAKASSILKLDGNISSSDTVPAVMVAVASSIIICAVALYISDLRDRCRYDPRYQPRRHHRRIKGKPVAGEWTPSETDQPEYVEDISIAPVSTMTASLADMENHSLSRTAKNFAMTSHQTLKRMDSDKYLAQSVDITELSDVDRVSGSTNLSSLVDLSRIYAIGSFAQMTTSTNDRRNEDVSLDIRDPQVDQRAVVEDITIPQNDSRHIRIDDTVYIMSDDEEDDSGWTSLHSCQSSEVSIGTYLRSVHSGKSRSSSVGSNGNSSGSAKKSPTELRGEKCLEAEDDAFEAQQDEDSLGRSPDTPYHKSHEVARMRNEFSQLEHLYNAKMEEGTRSMEERKLTPLEKLLERGRLPIQEYQAPRSESLEESSEIDDSLDQSYVRNIFYVPSCPSIGTSNSNALGIEFEGASCTSSYPSVKSVHGESPLRGRLFEGDKILAVNNKHTAGHQAKETEGLALNEMVTPNNSSLSLSEAVKLTVLSRNPDGSDDSSSSNSESDQVSMDTGIDSTAIEV